MILAGDVGGTKTNLALIGPDGELGETRSWPSADDSSLGRLVKRFLAETGTDVEVACIGVAGPVRGNVVHATNLPWTVEAGALRAETGIDAIWLINDLEATAYGIDCLGEGQLRVLNEGNPAFDGNRSVIAAGTGLGEAGMYFDGERYWPFASEGGHCSFSPRNELELSLWRFLAAEKRPVPVSWEHVVSGPGLHAIYRFLASTGEHSVPTELKEQLETAKDPSAVISRDGLAGRFEICTKALDLFATLYGAEAGNQALKIMASGGVYLGGGIAPKILPKLEERSFLDALCAKGPMEKVLREFPVAVILEDRCALLGAGEFARRRQG
ncbi:MAG: glucokinase [Planctomycetota bacterium]